MLVCGLITRQTYSVVQDSWLRFQLFFRERDLFSTEGYGKYQAQTREGVWVVSLFFYFLFLQRHDRGQQQTAIREMASTDMQGECERRNIGIGD